MAIVYLDGFEGYATTTDVFRSNALVKWQSWIYGSGALNNATYRTTQVTAANSRSLSVTGLNGQNYLLCTMPPVTEVIVGVGFYYSQAQTNYNGIILVSNGTYASQGIVLNAQPSSGALTVGIPNGSGYVNTILGTSATNLSINAWNYCEMRVKLGVATGEVEVCLNGTQVINLTGVNTATGCADYRQIYLGTFSNGYGPTFLFDDFYIVDKSGTTNTTFLGPINVYSLMPTANASSAQFTPTGVASNWDAVNDGTADTTTYVSSGTTGQKDYYTFEALPGAVTTVAGVQIKSCNQMPVGGTRKLKFNLKNGASVISSALKTLTVGTWVYDFFVSDTAPDGSAWTPANVNSSEGGIEAG